jgi:hypothetical protein
MTVLDKFDTDVNFWETNPQLKYIGVFEEFHNKDKSKGKKDSSQIMWAVALLLDKSKHNNFRNLPEDEKKEQLAKYFLKQPNFEWDEKEIKDLTDQYFKLCLSQAEKSLIEWERKLKERDEFIASCPYNAETYEMLDKLLSNTYKMYQMYQTVKSQLDLEQDTDETSKNRFTTEI